MDDVSIQVSVGSVRSLCGELCFAFVVRNDGDAHLQIYAHDPSDRRRSGMVVFLDRSQYDELKRVISKTDETIAKLQAAGQMTSMLARLT